MPSLIFHLEPRSAVPAYVQLIQQVRHALSFGLLHPGDRLPTVKEVAAQVAVNPNTVLRAYRDLEAAGLVVSRPGLGTFVERGLSEPPKPASYRFLRASLERWIERARVEGLDEESMASLFRDVLRDSVEGAA